MNMLQPLTCYDFSKISDWSYDLSGIPKCIFEEQSEIKINESLNDLVDFNQTENNATVELGIKGWR